MQIPMRAICVFHAAARMGSVSRAAEELGVTPSAVSQQIQVLESHLGITLMIKVGRHIALTEAGERYFSTITDGIDSIIDATREVRGVSSIMSLRVRATPTLSAKWLLPRLQSFLDAYPNIEVRLDGTNEPTDFSRETIDIELRHGDGRFPGLFVEGLIEESFVPLCAPSLAGADSLEPDAITSHRLIHSVKSQAQWGHWLELAGAKPSRPWRRVLFDRSHMAIDAAVDGMGIALESLLMTERERARGALVCPVRRPPEIRLVTQWIVCPAEHLRHKRVSLFLKWLRAQADQAGSNPSGRLLA